jgi:Ca2+/H+ antiporter
MGDSALMFFWSFVPMVVSLAVAILLIVLAVRLVRAVEKIADKLG